MKACEHDWRVDPRLMLATHPPQHRLVCAKCGQSRGSGIVPAFQNYSRDPNTWEPWRGPLTGSTEA